MSARKSITLSRVDLAALLSAMAVTTAEKGGTLQNVERALVEKIERRNPQAAPIPRLTEVVRSYELRNQAHHAWEWLADQIIAGAK